MLAAWPLWAQTSSSSSLEEARRLLKLGKLAEAKSQVEAVLKQRPDSPQALDLLAQTYLLGEDTEKASQSIRQALRNHPENAQAIATYGQCLFQTGNFREAEQQFRKSLKLDPGGADAHLGMGRILLSRMKTTEALESLQQAMRYSPDLAEAYFFASEAHGNDHNLSLQVQSLEKYISLNPPIRPERLLNAKALAQFFHSFEKEPFSEISDKSRGYSLDVRPFYGLMLIETRVNGEGPFRFLIDTGATSTVISNKLLGQLKVPPLATTVTRCVGGDGKIGTQLCKLSTLEIGDLKIKNLPVSSFDNAIFAELIDGVLSTSTLADFIITLDYSDLKLNLSPRPSPSTPVPKPASPAAGLHGEFRIFGNLLLVPVSINNQPPGNFLFDTGAVTSTLSKKQASRLGVTEDTPNSHVDIEFVGACGVTKSVLSVSNVSLGVLGSQMKFPQILAVDLQEISRELETEVSGILGGDFFSRYKVRLDYYNTTLKLEE